MDVRDLEKVLAGIIEDASSGRNESAWTRVESLLAAQASQDVVALALVHIVDGGHLPIEKALTVLKAIHAAHRRNRAVLGPLGAAMDGATDIDMLNAPPPGDPLFSMVVSDLLELLDTTQGSDEQTPLLMGLVTSARMMARQKDEIVEQAARRLIEVNPEGANHYYNLGLFLKTRGRFSEGMTANQTAEALLAGPPGEAYEWNLGICATGAGEAAVALQVWKRLGQKIEMGRFDLPDGRYSDCKVRLAERPLAERAADCDDPGLEETVWVERLSPCHGIIRSVLYRDLGVDYGDVVLFDGAPITYHRYGEDEVPVFPHLVTLRRRHYRFFDFAGTQQEADQIGSVTRDLEADAIVYSHSENFIQMCASCWRDPDVNHRHDDQLEKHVVRGRIAASANVDARELLRQIDTAIAKREPCKIYSPQLCEAAGLPERAAFEKRRYDMITD